MLFYNSMLSLPLLLLAVVLKGEPSSMTSYPLLWSPQVGAPAAGALRAPPRGSLPRPDKRTACVQHADPPADKAPWQAAWSTPLHCLPPMPRCPQFQLALMAASVLGLTINHSTFVCTRINEPLMTSVAGGCPGARLLVGWE